MELPIRMRPQGILAFDIERYSLSYRAPKPGFLTGRIG